MDPDAALDAIYEAITRFQQAKQHTDRPFAAVYAANDVVDAFWDLDRWLNKGGFLPKRWQAGETVLT